MEFNAIQLLNIKTTAGTIFLTMNLPIFKSLLRPDQFNFLFYENFGQKIKIGQRKK